MVSIWLRGVVLCVVFITGCYEPEKFMVMGNEGETQTVESRLGRITTINTGKQICNPSTSMDTILFPGAMLWLGFSGDLVVRNPPAEYTTSRVVLHDRLTISGADNSVKWWIHLDSIPAVRCEFQDPEWSTHASWIVTMGAYSRTENCEEGDLNYSGYIIRPADNARLRIARDNLDYISTPHFWLNSTIVMPQTSLRMDSVEYDAQGMASADAVNSFFGSREAVFVKSKIDNGYSLHYIDYRENTPVLRPLAKPAGRQNFKAEDAMISPDGRWVVYNLYERRDAYSVYLQELAPNSHPIALGEGKMDPRWWVHPDDPSRWFLIWMEVPTSEGYIIKQDLLDPEVERNGSAGSTWMRELRLFAGRSADLSMEWVGDARLLVNLPFRGGRSPDGRFISTGTNFGYMMELF